MHTLVLRGNTVGVPAGERIGESLLKHPELEVCLFSLYVVLPITLTLCCFSEIYELF